MADQPRPIRQLRLTMRPVTASWLVPGAVSVDIGYEWVENGETHHALTRLPYMPGADASERAAFLRRNNMREADRG